MGTGENWMLEEWTGKTVAHSMTLFKNLEENIILVKKGSENVLVFDWGKVSKTDIQNKKPFPLTLKSHPGKALGLTNFKAYNEGYKDNKISTKLSIVNDNDSNALTVVYDPE